MVQITLTNKCRLSQPTKFVQAAIFHTWRSFHFDENAKTIDAYVNRIRQVANLLGYQEPQILEVFKNTLPTKLYWVLFP